MIEPTDSEIIMYVSMLQTIKEKVEDETLRDSIVKHLGELLAKYSKMRRGDRYQMVKRFKENLSKMQEQDND